MKVLLIDSSYPINTRNKRLIVSLKRYLQNASIEYIAWNRDGREIAYSDTEMCIYDVNSAYGNLLSKLFHLIGYYYFLRKNNNLKRPDVIIASHWDMLFLSSLLKKKGQVLIYEDLDIPTAKKNYLLKLLQRVEAKALKKTDAIIFASRFFKPLYNSIFTGNKFILENKPMQISQCAAGSRQGNKFNIAYIGLVRYADILKNLIDAVQNNESVSLFFHGEGQDLEQLKKYAAKSSNIFFTGRYEAEQLPQLYANADVVWAAYPNKDYNVKFAISNKFHESIAYHIPCIYAENTLLGDLVIEKNLGYIVNPYSTADIKDCILHIVSDREDLLKKKISLSSYEKFEKGWDEQIQPFLNYLKSLK